MLDDFVIRAVLAGVGLSLATGPLGAFIIWRRMVFFGDAMAHAAILGVALALAFSLSIITGTLTVALIVGLSVSTLAGRGHEMDTTLAVLAHSALALGLVAISLVGDVRVDLSAFLFGDILTVSTLDLALIWCGSVAVLALLTWRWSSLLIATLNSELAAAAGINARREGLILTLAMAVVVALALKVVGALLIAAMMIIPAAAARAFARTPEGMAALAIGIGTLASIGGVAASLFADTPTGPSIVATAAAFYLLSIAAHGKFT